MQNNQSRPQRYIKINDEQIPVTEEIYYAYKRPLWAEHKRRKREAHCRNRSDDCGITKNCPCGKEDRRGRPLSLEKFSEDGFHVPDPVDVSETVEDIIRREALLAALNTLKPEDRHIAILFSQGASERKIAAEIGLSQKGVNKRKQKIFIELREILKDFF